MHFVREIYLRYVKCLRALEDLFHFTFDWQSNISQCEALFHILRKQNISLKKSSKLPKRRMLDFIFTFRQV